MVVKLKSTMLQSPVDSNSAQNNRFCFRQSIKQEPVQMNGLEKVETVEVEVDPQPSNIPRPPTPPPMPNLDFENLLGNSFCSTYS